MDQTRTRMPPNRNPPVGQRGAENLVDAADTDDGDIALQADGAGETSPRLRAQQPRKSFFSVLSRPESPEDALVRLEAERIRPYLPQLIKLEQDLGKILNELQALNKLLRAASTDGNQTALETAAGKVENAITLLTTEIGTLNQCSSFADRARIKKKCGTLHGRMKESAKAYVVLHRATKNRSENIGRRYAELAQKYRAANKVFKQLKSASVDGND